MSQDPLRIFNVGQAWRRIVYTANCSDCGYRTRVDLKKVAETVGDDFPLFQLRPRLRCSQCGSKRIIIATLDKDSGVAANALQRWPFPYD